MLALISVGQFLQKPAGENQKRSVLPAKFTQDCSAPRPPLLQGSSEVSSLSAKATSQHSLEETSLKSSCHIQRQDTLRGTHDLASKAAS